MIRNHIARNRLAGLLLLAGITISPVVSADGGILKCVASDGQVTLTDTFCQAGERSETLIAAPERTTEPAAASLAAPPRVARTASMVQARLSARNSTPGPAVGRFDPASRGLARDVLTLKAARQALILMDSAAGAMRNSRVAGLD